MLTVEVMTATLQSHNLSPPLTRGTIYASTACTLREVRCPSCGRLKCKLKGAVEMLEVWCRCKTKFVIQGYTLKTSLL